MPQNEEEKPLEKQPFVSMAQARLTLERYRNTISALKAEVERLNLMLAHKDKVIASHECRDLDGESVDAVVNAIRTDFAGYDLKNGLTLEEYLIRILKANRREVDYVNKLHSPDKGTFLCTNKDCPLRISAEEKKV